MSMKYREYRKVGEISLSLPCENEFLYKGNIYASPGVLNHIKKKHSKQLTKKVKENLISTIQFIIENPDYIGVRNREYLTLEIIKKVDATLLLGLQYDEENGYFYVSTLYPITDSKLMQRIYSGKLIRFDDNMYLKKRKRKRGA
ncbi:MAG: PBECR2 nuclease fold domain-containing protein [Clostridium sp.]